MLIFHIQNASWALVDHVKDAARRSHHHVLASSEPLHIILDGCASNASETEAAANVKHRGHHGTPKKWQTGTR